MTEEQEQKLNSKQIKIDTIVNTFKIMLNQMFVYTNVPEEIPIFKIEEMLQDLGSVLFIKVDKRFYITEYTGDGKLDAYRRDRGYVVSNPYIHNHRRNYDRSNSVVIYNNHLKLPLTNLLTNYAEFKTESELTTLTNLILSRGHKMLSASNSDDVESIDKVLRDLELGLISSISRSGLTSVISEHQIGGQVTDHEKTIKLEQYRKAELLNTFGIALSETIGGQYTSDTELTLNNSSTNSYVDNMLWHRETALEQINKMFGLNIMVEINPKWLEQEQEEQEEQEDEEVEQNDE